MDIEAYRLPILAGAALLFVASLIYLVVAMGRGRRRPDGFMPPPFPADTWLPPAEIPAAMSADFDEAARPGAVAAMMAEPLRVGDWRPVSGPEHALFDHPEIVIPAARGADSAEEGFEPDIAELAATLDSPVVAAPPAEVAVAPPPPPRVEVPPSFAVPQPPMTVAGVDDLTAQLALLGIGPAESAVPAGAAFAPVAEMLPVEPAVLVPEPVPVPEPMPAPEPEPVPEPVPAPVPEPLPAPAPEPLPAPAPEPLPEPAPAPEPPPEPAPEPEPLPAPESEPLPAPEPPAPAVPRPAVTVAAPRPEPSPAPPAAPPRAPSARDRLTLRVASVPVDTDVVHAAREADGTQYAPAPADAGEFALVSPVEMWFGETRIGVKAGSKTFSEFQRLATVLFDDLKSSRAAG